MRVKVARWGNSLAVRLPKGVIDDARLREGQEFEIEAHGNGRLTLSSVAPRYDLAAMVEEMRRLGQSAEPELVDWGPDVGSEILPDDEYSRLGAAAIPGKRD